MASGVSDNTKKTHDRTHARNLCGQLQTTRNYAALLPKVIKLMAHSDVGVKRICYASYAKHCHKGPGEALLAINTILQDSNHQSPLIRALVISTVSLIKTESTNGLFHKIISDGVQDTSAFVRRHAVVALSHISSNNDAESTEDSSQSKLIQGPLLSDPDPLVLSLSLSTTSCEGIYTPDEKTTLTLLNRLPSSTPDGQVQVMESLRSYSPSSEAQLLDILNVIDPYLDSVHLPVVTATMDVFLSLSSQVDSSLVADMYKRVRNTCTHVLQSSGATEVYSILLWLQQHITPSKTTPHNLCKHMQAIMDDSMRDNFRLVLDNSNDPPYLTVIKLEMLKYFVKGDNIAMVLDNVKAIVLTQYTKSTICDKAFQTLLQLRSEFSEPVNAVLNSIMKSGQLKIYQAILKYIHLITSYESPESEQVFNVILPYWKSLQGSELMVLLHLCSNFAHKEKIYLSYMYEISEFVQNPASNIGYDAKSALLSSLVLCFKAQPAEYQNLLRQAMISFDSSGDLILQEHVQWCAQKLVAL